MPINWDCRKELSESFHSDIAIVGLGVMGRNLALNSLDQDLQVAGWDADEAWADRNASLSANANFRYCDPIKALVQGLKSPRKVLLLVLAGDAVEKALQDLCPGASA